MNNFVKNKASKRSISLRKPVYGIGINDADYMTQLKVDGKVQKCPFYLKWKNMLKRCYSEKHHQKHPTYAGCSVVKEWLLFSNFREWMNEQKWYGLELDKDLKHKGNKEYSPDTCLFIPHWVNKLFNDCASKRGLCPIGVNFNKQSGKFLAHINTNGKLKHLGYFTTPTEASQTYKVARKAKIERIIELNKHPEISPFLAQHI